MAVTQTVEYGFRSHVGPDTLSLSKMFSWNGTAFTDLTTQAGNATASDVILSGTLGSEWYFGYWKPFFGIRPITTTTGVGGNVTYEYWNGTTWATAAFTMAWSTGTIAWTGGASPVIQWEPSENWTFTAVNGFSAWWMRARVTTAYTTTPIATTVQVAPWHDFDPITISLPENVSDFSAALLEVTGRDSVGLTTQGMWGGYTRLRITSLGAIEGEEGDIGRQRVESSPLVLVLSSGEHESWIMNFDYTSLFQGSWAYDARTARITLGAGMFLGVFVATGVINLTAKLTLTYDYDETASPRRTKTVRIPLESSPSPPTATLTEMGTNQVPALDTFLPEADKVYQDMFFEISGNEAATTNVDFVIGMALDSEAEHQDGVHDQILISAVWSKYLWKRTTMNTAVAHAFKIRTTVANRLCMPTVLLVVTYDYDEDDSTSIMNSIMIPWHTDQDQTTGTAALMLVPPITVPVQETNPVLKQSGMLCTTIAVMAAGSTWTFWPNWSTSSRTYTFTAYTTNCGQTTILPRVDTTWAGFGRGFNTMHPELDAENIPSATGIAGMLYLNYTSDKHPGGSHLHNRTVIRRAPAAYPTAVTSAKSAVWTLGTNAMAERYLVSLGLIVHFNAAIADQALLYRLGAGNRGHFGILTNWNTSGENVIQTRYYDLTPYYRRYDTQPPPLVPATARQPYTPDDAVQHGMNPFGANMLMSLCWAVTTHGIQYEIAGTVTGYTGDGSGLTVEAHRSDTDEKIGEAVTTAGGAFIIPWYDNTVAVYVHVRQDATHVGRSDDAVAV